MSSSNFATSEDLVFEPFLPGKEVAKGPVPAAQREFLDNLKREIDGLGDCIQSRAISEVIQNILSELVRFFHWLVRIEDNLKKLDTLLESISLLEVLQVEAHFFVEYLETKALHTEGLSEPLREVLDGIIYGINHDLRRIFERELTRETTQQSIPIVYGKILHAHGLLTNCFQQSTITLLQALNPKLDVLTIFNDSELRLKQSLVLTRDLSSLMRSVQIAESQADPDTLRKVVGKILEFRDGSMPYLMYKDWRSYETQALEVITAIENNLDAQSLLHRFYCYLEIVYGHVKMRSVLANSFPYAGEANQE